MAYSVLKNNSNGKMTYVADYTEDLVGLKLNNPSVGTSCLVIATGKFYFLNSTKEWIENSSFDIMSWLL